LSFSKPGKLPGGGEGKDNVRSQRGKATANAGTFSYIGGEGVTEGDTPMKSSAVMQKGTGKTRINSKKYPFRTVKNGDKKSSTLN